VNIKNYNPTTLPSTAEPIDLLLLTIPKAKETEHRPIQLTPRAWI